MRINELIWDAWNEEHIAAHSVRIEEVEEMVRDRSSLFVRASGHNLSRYMAFGRTDAGRYLTAVVDLEPGDLAYVVTARTMTTAERKRFVRSR